MDITFLLFLGVCAVIFYVHKMYNEWKEDKVWKAQIEEMIEVERATADFEVERYSSNGSQQYFLFEMSNQFVMQADTPEALIDKIKAKHPAKKIWFYSDDEALWQIPEFVDFLVPWSEQLDRYRRIANMPTEAEWTKNEIQ